MRKQQKVSTVVLLNAVTVLHAGDSYLEGYTLINWTAFFLFVLLLTVVVLSIFIKSLDKKIIKIFVLWLVFYLAGYIEAWYKSYLPSVSYSTQSPYSYGVYEEAEEIAFFHDTNVTRMIPSDHMMRLLVVTNTDLWLFEHERSATPQTYDSENFLKFQSKISIDHLGQYNIVYIDDTIFVLNQHYEIVTIYALQWHIQKQKYIFWSVKSNEALLSKIDKYINIFNIDYNWKESRKYGIGEGLVANESDCKDISSFKIIANKDTKSFVVCCGYEGKKSKTTYLKYTPKDLIYLHDSDAVLITYEEKNGLFVLKNKYTKVYSELQNSVTRLLKSINRPWWNKVDLTQIDLDQSKLKRLLDIFKPYEQDQNHYVDYTVVAYDGNSSVVRAMIDSNYVFDFYLAIKNKTWKVFKIEEMPSSALYKLKKEEV